MSKAAVFTMKLEPELRSDFMAAAAANHRPASQVLRELMRDFVRREQGERDYRAFLQGKVDAARASLAIDSGHSDEEVEAEFAARRARIAGGT